MEINLNYPLITLTDSDSIVWYCSNMLSSMFSLPKHTINMFRVFKRPNIKVGKIYNFDYMGRVQTYRVTNIEKEAHLPNCYMVNLFFIATPPNGMARRSRYS